MAFAGLECGGTWRLEVVDTAAPNEGMLDDWAHLFEPECTPTPTLNPTRAPTNTSSPTPTSTNTPTLTPTPDNLPCVGDCNGDGVITVDEIVLGMNIALGLADLATYPEFDRDENGSVGIDELVLAVGASLHGCI